MTIVVLPIEIMWHLFEAIREYFEELRNIWEE